MTEQSCNTAAPSLDQPDEVLDTACRILLTTNTPLPLGELAEALGADPVDVEKTVAEHERRGRIGRDAQGAIVASAGVSIEPSEYELRVGARVLWAWCAKTALGVMSALGMDGVILSRSPHSGVDLRTEFTGSRPAATDAVVYWPSDGFRDTCGSAADDYCPSFSMFENAQAALAWARTSQVPGEVLTVDEATGRAAGRWRQSLDIAGEGRQLSSVLAHGMESDARRP